MKKVLVYGISDCIGGIENLVFSIITNLQKQDIGFDIITYYDHIENQELYEKMGVHIYTITSKRKNPIKNKKEFHLFFKTHAKEYDAVWCNLSELINIDILKIAKKYGIKKRIIHSHNTASMRNKLLTLLHVVHRKKIRNIATDFLACSSAAGSWFYPEDILKSDKFHVIKNGISPEQFLYNTKQRKEIREEFSLADSFVIGHVGRLIVQQKNTLFLLSVFKEVLNLQPNAKLLLVGDGPDRALLQQESVSLGIDKNTIFAGARKDVCQLLNAMDVFALPSNFEGLGIVLLEAQTNGLPCFTSSVVPKEVAVTDLIQFIDLDESPLYWAKKILAAQHTKRESREQDLINSGYSISESACMIKKLFGES